MATRSKKAHRSFSPRQIILAVGVAVALALTGTALFIYGPGWVGSIQAYIDPDRAALRTALRAPDMSDLRAGYAVRRYELIWLRHGRARPEATAMVERIAKSAADGLEPEIYDTPRLSRMIAGLADASRADRIQAELALTKTFADYVADLRTPLPAAEVIFTDPDLTPARPRPAVVIDRLARAPSLQQGIAQATQMNPLYVELRQALAAHRGRDAASERLLLINLERMRALPADLGARFVLVDAASGQLQLYENGHAVDAMKVIVGTPQHSTPNMAALIRYAVFNPNWNVPPDLTQATYAPRIAANRSALADLRMDAWSDYTPQAYKLDPDTVNWEAVAHGAKAVWLRQRPGAQNSMGAVKFMLPNELGIYLHDTPNKALFAQPLHTFSAGCVRVEDYQRLARWLYKATAIGPKTADPEQRIDLPAPVPVYITYRTAALENGGLAVRKDVYGRDPALLAQLGTATRRPRTHSDRPSQTIELRRLTAS